MVVIEEISTHTYIQANDIRCTMERTGQENCSPRI